MRLVKECWTSKNTGKLGRKLNTYPIWPYRPASFYLRMNTRFILEIQCYCTPLQFLDLFAVHTWCWTSKYSSHWKVLQLSKSKTCFMKQTLKSFVTFMHLEGDPQNLRMLNDRFKIFFCQLHEYLSQNWCSNGHFEVLSRSKSQLVQKSWQKTQIFPFLFFTIL